jgi:hypothetical protein
MRHLIKTAMSDEPNRVHPRRFAPPPPAGDINAALYATPPAGDSGNSRRIFLDKCFSSLLLLIGISSCETKEKKAGTLTNPCFDYSELSEEDLAKRKSLGYVEKAPTENKHCGNCNLWLPPKNDDPCGRCQLFKGPAPAEAYCTYWAPQV